MAIAKDFQNICNKIRVHKFGGSSLNSKESFERVLSIINKNSNENDWVVVSASGKTTNNLIDISELALHFSLEALDRLDQLERYQISLMIGLPDELAHTLKTILQQDVRKIRSYINNITTQPISQPQWLCFGEIWSARLLACMINVHKKNTATFVDARKIIRAGSTEVDFISTTNLFIQSGLLQNNSIKVITGFIASDSGNQTQTLGRNGSDYTASLLAKLTAASQLIFWTDVSGVYSADPKFVKSAVPFTQMNWEVANILAQSGNFVLHSQSVTILSDCDCEILIKNSLLPEAEGTKIVKQNLVCTPLVSRGLDYGLMCGSRLTEVDQTHVAFQLETPTGKKIVIRDEYINLYDADKFALPEVHLFIVFGCIEKFNQFLKTEKINILHIHSFNSEYRFLITDQRISDETYELFHDYMRSAEDIETLECA